MPSDRTPARTADRMVSLLFDETHVLEFDRILYPACRGTALVEAVFRYCERESQTPPDGVALTSDTETAGELRSEFPDRSLDVIETDVLAEGESVAGAFDYTICHPPSIEWGELDDERRREYAAPLPHVSPDDATVDSDALYMERTLQQLRPDGRGVFLVDTGLKSAEVAAPSRDRLAPLINDITRVRPPEDAAGSEPDEMIAVVTGEGEGEYDPDTRVHWPDPETIETQLAGGVSTSVDQRPVRAIMTPHAEVDAYAADRDASFVYFDMFYKDYDATLIYDDPASREGLRGYVSRAELKIDGTEPIEIDHHATAIPESRCVDPTAGIDTVIPVLGRYRFCFVGTPDSPEGLVTRYDLNKLPVYRHLYDQFARFEIGLRRLIRREAPDWESRSSVTLGVYGASELVPDALATAQLRDLVAIVRETGLASELGADIGGHRSSLHDLVDLRNTVAHYNPVVHVMSSRPTAEDPERGAPQLAAEYHLLSRCLSSLDALFGRE